MQPEPDLEEVMPAPATPEQGGAGDMPAASTDHPGLMHRHSSYWGAHHPLYGMVNDDWHGRLSNVDTFFRGAWRKHVKEQMSKTQADNVFAKVHALAHSLTMRTLAA